MAPKQDARGKGKGEPRQAAPSILEVTFPVWNDATIAAEKDTPEKYLDPAGTVLPPETQAYLDTWKRPEELVQNAPNVPLVVLKPGTAGAGAKEAKKEKGALPMLSRELDGKMFAGHKTFEWLQCVFQAVMAAQKALKPGEFLWELIYPKDKDGMPLKTASGKYKVKLCIMDSWRTVTVDDRIPVDLFGRALLVGVRPLQLWPLLLSKAVLKVMAAQRILHMELPHQVSAYQLLTGWPAEDLVDPLSGTPLVGGFLFDRLEEAVKGIEAQPERHQVATACLVKRALPERPPPRVIVLAGPSAVGRGPLMRRLVEEFPDKFGVTVGHTTRRPREHEVHGKHYFFLDKSAFKAEVSSGRLLEHTTVHTVRGRYKYGISIASVREVAATGKLCVMALDVQGVRELQANKRIDGLYFWVAPPSEEVLETRQRGRLKEDDTTIAKRMDWAEQQVTKAKGTPLLYDHLVENGEEDKVYYDIKEAISTLSPIIRNRLRGLPAYVLDYSDLIPPNLVEKPFLKPVIIAGPNTGERRQLMEMLVREFPDVFAFPRMHTTRRRAEEDYYQVTQKDEEEEALKAKEMMPPTTPMGTPLTALGGVKPRSAPGTPSTRPGTGGGSMGGAPGADPGHDDAGAEPGAEEEGADEAAKGEGAGEGEKKVEEVEQLYPEPVSLSPADFDAATKSGRFLVYQEDLFKHPLNTYRYGVTMEDVKEVIRSGKLPLLELENDGVEMMKAQGIDCLKIFLNPPSLEVYKDRVHEWLTETDEEIATRREIAAEQLAQAATPGANGKPPFDHTLVNEDLDATYEELKRIISKHRPDIMVPESEQEKPEEVVAKKQPVLILAGPAGAGRENLAQMLVQMFPDKFAQAPVVTDRKPAKGEAPTDMLSFAAAKEMQKLVAAGGVAVQFPMEGGSGYITTEAITAITAQSKVCILDLPDPDLLPPLRAGPHLKDALYVFVASKAMLMAGTATIPGLELPPAGAPREEVERAVEAALDGLMGPESVYDSVICAEDMEAVSQARDMLCRHVPDIVPPPFKPLVVAGPFGTGKRVLLQRLFDALPGKFAVPVITTTKEGGQLDKREEMEVVSKEAIADLQSRGAFLLHHTTRGKRHDESFAYGITLSAVKKVQASGRICVVEVDRVEDLVDLQAKGFEATYVYMGMESMDTLLRLMREEVMSNPPLGYEPEEAVTLMFNTAKAEIARSQEASVREQLHAWVLMEADQGASYHRLVEAVHLAYPEVVSRHFTYGYGRHLWDPSVRMYGQKPLKVMVLGPAAVGKSTQCELLAAHFNIPHINVGDLLYEEVKNKTPLGLEAKVYMDSSKTVPDKYFLELLEVKLKEPDCMARGWLLDGFPHMRQQVTSLFALGIFPDKVVFMEAENVDLLDRVRYRKYDYVTHKTYHVVPEGAAARSEPILPLDKDGRVDKAVMARLSPRHDDSEENVNNRLKLWDLHYPDLRAAFEDVSLRVSGTIPVSEAFQQMSSFVALESAIVDMEVVESHKLKELQYEVVDTLRYKRRQLVKVWQPDRKTFWVDLKELASNSHCLQLHTDPGPEMFEVSKQLRRVDLTSVHRQALLYVDWPEPIRILCALNTGMQYPLLEDPPVTKRVLVVSGPPASGKSSLISMLVADSHGKLRRVVAATSRPPHKGDVDGANFQFIRPEVLGQMAAAGSLMGFSAYDGASYGVRRALLADAWQEGCVAVVEAPKEVAESLRTSQDVKVTCLYLDVAPEQLDQRMRQQDLLTEQQLQHALQLAAQQRAALAAAAGSAGAAGSDGVDHVLLNDSLMLCYHRAKEVCGSLWHRPHLPLPCQLNLEVFDWARPQPGGPTLKRIRAVMGNASMLELPRGKHLLRIDATNQYLHAVTFLSNVRFEAEEYAQVLPKAHPELHVSSYNGEYPGMAPGTTALLFRYSLKVASPTTLCTTLAVSGEDVRFATRFILVDNATGAEHTFPGCRAQGVQLQPGDKGYCLMAVAQMPATAPPGAAPPPPPVAPSPPPRTPPSPGMRGGAAAGTAPSTPPGLEDGSWLLTLTSTTPLTELKETPVSRVVPFKGTYHANVRGILGRQFMSVLVPTQIAVSMSTEPPLPVRFNLFQLPPIATEAEWGKEYPSLVERYSPEGSLFVPNLTAGTSRLLVQMQLDGAHCPTGYQPDPVTGELPNPVNWRATFLPTTDDKMCVISNDESQQKYFKKVLDHWNTVPVALAVPAAPPAGGKGGAPAKPAAAAKGGASAGVGGPRAQVAQAMLEKYAAEVAGAGAAKAEGDAPAPAPEGTAADDGAAPAGPPPPPQRVLKDGSLLDLDPDKHLQVVAGGTAAGQQLLAPEALAQRQAEREEAAAAAPKAVAEVAAGLQLHKQERQVLQARKASEFSEWRSKQLGSQREVRSKRVEAVKGIKEQMAAAAAAAAAEAQAAAEAAAAKAAQEAGAKPADAKPALAAGAAGGKSGKRPGK